MVARGRVQNGVVVLEGNAHLPERQEVSVLAPPLLAGKGHGILDIGARQSWRGPTPSHVGRRSAG